LPLFIACYLSFTDRSRNCASNSSTGGGQEKELVNFPHLLIHKAHKKDKTAHEEKNF
jgi:hypothetical protein